MKPLWTAVAGVAAALVVGALVVVLFSDRIAGYLPGWMNGQDLQGGPQVVLEVEPDGVELGRAVEDSIRIIGRRLNDLGTKASVQQQGAARIVLQLPRSANAKRSIEVATRRGKLQLRLVDQTMTVEQAMRGQPPMGSEVLYDRADKSPYLVEKLAWLSSRDVADAQPAFDQRTNEPVVTFRFTASGARKFAQLTQENVGRPFAIVFDGEVLSAPVIREPIVGGSGQISGSFTVVEANDMAVLLRAGELPGRLIVIEAP